ncbi:MAG: hypothetical protein GEU95_21795 [Rhizobiales bacterium]|nr:hypothetical protein [Hyphomicrobiales bacterium]
MRRQTAIGRATPAGSSRDERLDPFTLPVQFSVADKAADGRVRYVELTRDRVVVRRAVRGMKMAVNLPVTVYLGVALRMEPAEGDAPGAVSIILEHRDNGLSLPLFRADDGTDIVAEWQSWARVLGMPLLVTGPDGRLREAFHRIGAVRVASPTGRRRRRSAIRMRRPSILLRRKVGRSIVGANVHREREIIARD